MEAINSDLSRFKRAQEWRLDQASSFFKTDGAWEFFKRRHRRELMESGALIVRLGRSGDLVDSEAIGGVVQTILLRESLARLDLTAEAV